MPIQNPYTRPGADANTPGSDGMGSVAQQVRIGMIITFAMAQGVIVIGVILWFIGSGDAEQAAGQSDDRLFLLIGTVATALACLAAIVIPRFMRASAIARFRSSGEVVEQPIGPESGLTPECGRLVAASQAWTLVGQAVLEGAATLNLVLMFIDHDPLHAGMALICLIGILLQTPTVGKKLALIEAAAA